MVLCAGNRSTRLGEEGMIFYKFENFDNFYPNRRNPPFMTDTAAAVELVLYEALQPSTVSRCPVCLWHD